MLLRLFRFNYNVILTRKRYFFFLAELIFFATLLVCTSVVVANRLVPVAAKASAMNTIGKHFAVYTEAKTELTFAQARAAYDKHQFTNSKHDILSFGIGAAPMWLVTEVDNSLPQAIKRRFVIENSWLDHANIYLLYNDELVKEIQLGDQLPFSAREIDHRFFAFDHDYLPGKTQLFIHVDTPDPMVLPMTFGSQQASYKRDILNSYSYGLLYGIVLALLLYNLIIFLRLRLKRYLFYVIYLGMFMAMNLSYTGHGYYLFWPDFASIQHWNNPFLITLYAVSGILFALSFLETHKFFPRIFYFGLLICLAMIISQGVFFLHNLQTEAVIFAIGYAIFYSVFTLILAILSLNYKLRSVLLFLIATITTLIGTSITSMAVWSLLPYNDFTFRAIEIGLAIDAILLSIALAEQFRILQNEKYQAEHLARFDQLTGLYNRRAFYELVAPITVNALRYQQNLSVIILDIDRFKRINDTYGHSTGDKVIKITAEMIQKITRKGDISSRWGGEEFTILLPETNLEHARQLAERLRETIAQMKLFTTANPISITASLGVAEMTPGTPTVDELIKIADARLYQAKKAGRNRVF